MADEIPGANTATPDGGTAQPTDPAAQSGTQDTTPPAGGDAASGTNQNSPEAGAAGGVPEKYELNLPEGTLQPAELEAVQTAFKGLELTQKQAQGLMEIFAAQKANEPAVLQQKLEAQHAEWTNTVKNDPELGGKNYAETEKFAQSAIARFGSPGLKEYLNNTGLGSHPELVRTFTAIGKAMSEDVIHSGKATGETGDLFGLYPSMKPK